MRNWFRQLMNIPLLVTLILVLLTFVMFGPAYT